MRDEELFQAIIRGMKRQIEHEVIEDLRSIPRGCCCCRGRTGSRNKGDRSGGTGMNNDIVGGFDDEEMEGLTIRLEEVPAVDGCLVIQCSGWSDLYNYKQIHERVAKVLEAGFTRLIFDLRAIAFVEDPFPSFATLRAVKAKGGDIVLQGVPPQLFEVFLLHGFSQFFTFTRTLEESVAHFSHPPADALFPRVFTCPICEVKVRAVRAGRFRCPHCRTILVLAATGAFDLG